MMDTVARVALVRVILDPAVPPLAMVGALASMLKTIDADYVRIADTILDATTKVVEQINTEKKERQEYQEMTNGQAEQPRNTH